MVSIISRLGPKGQVLVPKLFRQEFGFIPGEDIVLKDVAEGVLISRKPTDVVGIFEEIAKSSQRGPKGDIVHGIYEEYEERWQRSRKRT